MRRVSLVFILVMFTAVSAFSLDFGLLVAQKVDAENNFFSYSPAFTPWVSWAGDKGVSFYGSGIFTLTYNKYSGEMSNLSGWTKPALTPELGRFALVYRKGTDFFLEAGRVSYEDALIFAASEFFDGLRVEMDFPQGTISAGAFYSGFQYKESAKILMTGTDGKIYAEPWAFDNFDAYFASRRALGSFRWDMPLGENNMLALEALAQFDLNGKEESLHSQYGIAKIDFYPKETMSLALGAIFQAKEHNDIGFGAAFGVFAGFKADVPGDLNDWVDINGKFTSGDWNDNISSFIPITSITQGEIFTGTLAGLARLEAGYHARFNSLLAGASLRYFINTADKPMTEGKLCGGEIWGSADWQPMDDLRLGFGAGAFLPSLGNAKLYEDKMQWKLSFDLTLSI